MNRRAFVTGLGAVLAAPLGAGAQPTGKVWRIGALQAWEPNPDPLMEAFHQGLREAGYTEGQSFRVEGRWAKGKLDRLPELAAELVRSNVDVILTGGNEAAQAAKQATQTSPIVMVTGDAVQAGVVASLERPGGNVTGVTVFSSELAAKRLELLKQTVPKLTRVAVLWNSANRPTALQVKEAERASKALGLAV